MKHNEKESRLKQLLTKKYCDIVYSNNGVHCRSNRDTSLCIVRTNTTGQQRNA